MKCSARVLTKHSFKGLKRLKRLDLINNNECDSKNIFGYIPQLECLVAIGCNPSSMRLDYNHLTSLKQVKLSGVQSGFNPLRIVESLSPKTLNCLMIYNVFSECLTYVLSSIGSRLINLRVLNINGTTSEFSAQIKEFKIDWLSDLRDLRQLSLERIDFEIINLNFSSPETLMPHLEELYIARIGCNLYKGIFRHLSSLKSLRIDCVNFLNENALEELVNLEILSLGINKNNLFKLTQPKLVGLVKLERLYLYAKFESHIEPSVFAHMPNLWSVRLGCNVSVRSQQRLREAYRNRIKFDFEF